MNTSLAKIIFSILIVLGSNQVFSQAEWGVMMHDDGDSIFSPQRKIYESDCSQRQAKSKQEDPAIHRQYLKCRYSNYREIGIDTLKINVYSGVPYFGLPGRRTGSSQQYDVPDEDDSLSDRVRLQEKLYALGARFDPIETAFSSFRQGGGRTVLSFRIADSHYLQVLPQLQKAHPLTPHLLLEKPSLVIGKGHLPSGLDPRLAGLMDFEYPEVRKHFLGVVQAGLERYRHVVDAVEVDFTRNPVLFKAEHAKNNANLINELLLSIRGLARKGGQKNINIMVRVPMDVERNIGRGLDVEYWLKNRLVDVVVPSDLMTTDGDAPIEPIVRLAKQYQVTVYLGMPARRNTTLWRFNPKTQVSDIFSNDIQIGADCEASCVRKKIIGYVLPSPDYLIGAALNAKAKGVDGIELYNFASESLRARPWYSKSFISNLKVAVPAGPVTFGGVRNSEYAERDVQDRGSKLPRAVKGESRTNFRILVTKKNASYTWGQLKIGLLDGSGSECKLWEATSNRALTPVETNHVRYSNKDLTKRETTAIKAIQTIGNYFPETAVVFRFDRELVQDGYNDFSIVCPRDNVLMNAELTLRP